ncbi:hypothetical protein Q5H92_07010 [Hymenobacter sp. M29]|uniref:Uncharacterized protein n=1 Tax=Hymenobacter mellowenesis TaxID=3063995 RepID=A0ABT9ABJ4_9BACT|nr:hypothetical protein [Hymenobacter sp. M29]MDO7846097.1 hypothetical protein [Hymenobacter sp. M29]
MTSKSKVNTVQLKYTNPSFPGQKWHAFLKNCNAQFYTSRKESIWHSIRGKGFIIWISEFSVSQENGNTVWYSEIELSQNTSRTAVQTLQEFIEGALSQFEKLAVIS